MFKTIFGGKVCKSKEMGFTIFGISNGSTLPFSDIYPQKRRSMKNASLSSSNLIRTNIQSKIGQPLSDEEFTFFTELLHVQTIAPKEILIHEGDRCTSLYFVQKGALCSYLADDKGDAHVVQFALEGYWISDLYSFFSGKPALFSVEALEACELLVLDKAGFQTACDRLHKFERFFRILIQNAYVNAQYRIARTFSAEAEQRYCDLVEQHPDIVQRVPQYLIASYLGVKPQSLSRIRKQIFERR